MMNSIFRKSNWTVLLLAAILFVLFAAIPVLADYSGHVASFKSEKNAVVFVHEMRAKGLYAYYQKEDVPGKGEFFRAYIGRYKTPALAQKALAELKKSGKINSFEIREATEKSAVTEPEKTVTVAQKNEPVQKYEDKPEIAAQKNETGQKPESKTELAEQKSEPVQKSENKTDTVAQKNEPAQKQENKKDTAVQKDESAQKQESKIEPVEQKIESVQKSENKTEIIAQKKKSVQKAENKNAPSVDTRHYYDGIKGIVLNNGRIIKGQIISIDENDVLKIRTRSGRILSYSFTKDVKEYITGY